jgi:hypothetical protein
MDFSKFHIVCVISNPIRYGSRYALYKTFKEDIERKGAQLWTVEMATGARPHAITSKDDPRAIQLWSSALPGELWHKENLINIGIQQVILRCPDARYIAWIDADIKFEPGQLEATVHALQHYDVVQMWSHAIDMDPEGQVLGDKIQLSFMHCYWKGIEPKSANGYTQGGHPGFAWAARREALNKLGGLIDWGVLGSSDRHMACALVSRVKDSVHGKCHRNYHKWLLEWQARADKHIRKNVGVVPGTIRHLWHGRKADRGYSSRWQILVNRQFDPDTDLKKDVSGLWQLVSETPRQIDLRDDIREYFRSRREDATTVS